MEKMKRSTKAWVNLILLGLTLVVNGLGAFGIINGMSQKEISDMYQTLITPAPSTFSIWSLIYGLLIISLVVMIIKNEDDYYGPIIDRITPLFWLSCALNIIWIVSFSFLQIGLSTIFILAFAISLSLIVKQIGALHTKKRWLLPAAFGMYSGWLLIATVVNVAAWLVKVGWDGFGISPEIWSIIILIVAVLLTLMVVFNTKNAIIPLPIAWGYYGIYQFLNAPEGFNGRYTILPLFAIIGLVFLIGIAGIQFYRNQYGLMLDPAVRER